MTPEQRLIELGLELPPTTRPRGSFEPWVIEGNWLYLSGKGDPLRGEIAVTPKVGHDISTARAREHARLVGLQLIAIMKEALGDLSRVKRIVKVLGMVNAVADFTEHTEVVNGCSDLFLQVFGSAGEHARSAVGVSSLPKGFAVEIEAVIALKG